MYKPFLGYIAFFTVSYFISEILNPPGGGKRRNSENFYLFSPRKLQRFHNQSVKPIEIILKTFCKILPTILGEQRTFWFLRPLKHVFHHSENHFQKNNIGRESPESQWLIPFRIMHPSKLTLQWGRKPIKLVLIQGQ